LRRQRLYILLLVFIFLVNALVVLYSGEGKLPAKSAVTAATKAALKAEQEKRFQEEIIAKSAETEKALRQNRELAILFTIVSLLLVALFLLGVVLDIIFLSGRVAKRRFHLLVFPETPVKWTLVDVAKVVILFAFFGYVLVIIESFLLGLFPAFKNDNLRMMINSSILDILVVCFIIHFTVGQYKESLQSLGISLKNFVRNVYYGIAGYIAAVPVLLGILGLIIVAINVTRYVPEKQPIVELFMKEQNASFLAYTSIFAAVVGPVIEELFFRGFLYNALKKSTGIFLAMLITASLFAGLHTNIIGFLPIMVLGLLLAYLYEKTGSLVASITVHIIHNLSMVFLVFLMRQI
jgi:uncharacterized protein